MTMHNYFGRDGDPRPKTFPHAPFLKGVGGITNMA